MKLLVLLQTGLVVSAVNCGSTKDVSEHKADLTGYDSDAVDLTFGAGKEYCVLNNVPKAMGQGNGLSIEVKSTTPRGILSLMSADDKNGVSTKRGVHIKLEKLEEGEVVHVQLATSTSNKIFLRCDSTVDMTISVKAVSTTEDRTIRTCASSATDITISRKLIGEWNIAQTRALDADELAPAHSDVVTALSGGAAPGVRVDKGGVDNCVVNIKDVAWFKGKVECKQGAKLSINDEAVAVCTGNPAKHKQFQSRVKAVSKVRFSNVTSVTFENLTEKDPILPLQNAATPASPPDCPKDKDNKKNIDKPKTSAAVDQFCLAIFGLLLV